MTTRNVLKFAAIFVLCLMAGLAATLFRIAGPDGLDLVNPKVLFHSSTRGAYFRENQWLADAHTLVCAVRYWFEPERTLAQIPPPAPHTGIVTNAIAALGARVSPAGGIISTSAPSEFNPVPSPVMGASGATFDDATGGDKLGTVSGGALGAATNG